MEYNGEDIRKAQEARKSCIMKGFEKSESDVDEAMKHENKLGAGAKKRKGLNPDDKVEAVMKEYKRGTLHSGSGEIVTNRKQAIAIAMSEAGKTKRE